MFPVTEKYFENVYIDKNTSKPIELSDKLKHNLRSKTNKLISLYYLVVANFATSSIEGNRR